MTEQLTPTTDANLVSVMVPAFNAASTILATLDSVWAQTHRPVELVVVNDGSTDDTERLINGWAVGKESSDFRIVVVSQSNSGLLASRSRGLQLAQGQYLQFLDADDVLHHQKLSRCVPYLADANDVVVPRTDLFRDVDAVLGKLAEEPDVRPWTARELRRVSLTRSLWHSAGPLFRREIVEAVGGFSTHIHPVAEEIEFHGRVKLATQRICYLGDVLNYYRIGNQASVTGSLLRLYEGRIAGAEYVRELLEQHGNRSFRERSSLLAMCLRTYYQAVCCTTDDRLQRMARTSFLAAARSWSPLGSGLKLFPSFIVESVFRLMHRIRGGMRTDHRGRFSMLRAPVDSESATR